MIMQTITCDTRHKRQTPMRGRGCGPPYPLFIFLTLPWPLRSQIYLDPHPTPEGVTFFWIQSVKIATKHVIFLPRSSFRSEII